MAVHKLRFLTYLSPSIPLSLYEGVTGHLGKKLGVETSLASIESTSGPLAVGRDPLSRGEVDIAFFGAPSYLWLRDLKPSPIQLIDAAPVATDARNEGRPVCFSEVIVERDAGIASFDELEGCLVAYNNTQSLSGYYALLRILEDEGRSEHFFSSMHETGGQLRSIQAVCEGVVDGAAIDSLVLAFARRQQPDLDERIQIIRSIGPLPVQPIVARAGLSSTLQDAIAEALCGMHEDTSGARILSDHGLDRFTPPERDLYDRNRLLAHYGP